MKVEIKSRFTGAILIQGDYKSVKDCLEQNRHAYLGGADLRGADLVGADLVGAYLRGADLRGADLRGADLGGAYLGGAYLGGAYLGGADLRGADLRGADLRGADIGGAGLVGADLVGADLGCADLRDIKGYSESHDMFAEAIRRQKADMFTNTEWAAIGKIVIHRLCWDSIKKRFSEVMPSIFSKLADAGFDEWLKRWNEINC